MSQKIDQWLLDNDYILKYLTKGQVFAVFENNEIHRIEDTVIDGHQNKTYWQVSPSGNKRITRLSICDQEGCCNVKASQKMSTPTCSDCIEDRKTERSRTWYQRNKAKSTAPDGFAQKLIDGYITNNKKRSDPSRWDCEFHVACMDDNLLNTHLPCKACAKYTPSKHTHEDYIIGENLKQRKKAA